MIVKVQVPLISNASYAPALIYAEGRKHMGTFPVDQLPKEVFEAAAKTGKAYFYAQFVRGRIRFHKQAPAQDW